MNTMKNLSNINSNLHFDTIATERGDMRSYIEDGEWRKTAQVNLSTELSTLIKEAANCSFYASDLLIDLFEMQKKLDAGILPEEPIYLGFLDMGVDHDTFIEARLNERMYGDPRKTYREIYKIEFTPIVSGEFSDFEVTFSKWDRVWKEAK